MLKRIPHVALLLAVTGILSACYLPARFDAEIKFNRQGYYDIIFDGYLVHIPTYEALNKGEMTPAQEKEKVAIVTRDIKRSPSAKEFSYIKKGHFKIHWEKKGDLLQQRMITFLRRDKPLITLQYVRRTGLITMRGTSLKKADAKRLAEAGLNMQGEIRFKSDAKVISHNATKVVEKKGQREVTYIWKINSLFGKAPKLEISVR